MENSTPEQNLQITDPNEGKPKLYILVHNLQKPNNIGMMVRSCSAFNVQKVFLISKDPETKKKSKIFKKFGLKFGDQGTSSKMDYHFFYSIKEAKEYFNENNITICGIEIGEGSQNVNTAPWKGDTVLVPGNEGHGMMDSLKAICDQLVYIPQYTSKTASLNVTVATSIVLQRFASWADYQEASVHGEKFLDPVKEKEKYDARIKALQEKHGVKKRLKVAKTD